MAIPAPKTGRARSLRTGVLLLIALGFVAVSVPAYWGFTTLVNSTVAQLATLFAEKQILFDRSRGIAALGREVALAENLMRSPVIADWARNETDLQKQALAVAELEQYREAFADHSYFFVVDQSGRYYYNDAQNSHGADKQYAFTVHRDNPSDAWYYATVALGPGCHLNVDHDDELDVTKVWINCVVQDGQTVLGVLGTGIDLSDFIRHVVDFPQAGVQTMFIDGAGAIQAHRDPRFIDFHSLTNAIESRKTIFSLLDAPADRAALQEMMTAVAGGSGGVEVRSRFMSIDGRQVLVGVGYLGQLGWYNVSFMNVDAVIDRGMFLPIGLLILGAMIAVALIILLIFRFTVLDRLANVQKGVVAVSDAVRQGETPPVTPDPRNDEIGRLSQSIAAMASSVQDNLQTLEMMVEERTAELHALAYRDQLTGIANRRGFAQGFDQVRAGAGSEATLAMLLIDIDRFKDINDGHGHQAGDEVAAEIARRIAAVLRPSDICGRWGGDEFIVLFADLGSRSLKVIAEAVKRGLSQPVAMKDGRSIAVTVSVGACIAEPHETLEQVADMADTALYRAKQDGRDRVVVYDPTRSRSVAGLKAG